MGYSIYAAYQQALKYRGAVDFEDLIRLAYKVLKNNPDYLAKLRRRWPVILEDEAQDSSLIQEKLLSLLCGDDGNWVRVGDPIRPSLKPSPPPNRACCVNFWNARMWCRSI
jgi:DNA helicase-2/ATP-dependent DNA helicase PcrA